MNITLILAYPDHKSFNHAIAAVALETLEKISIAYGFTTCTETNLTRYCRLKNFPKMHGLHLR